MFRVIYQGKYGSSVTVNNPYYEALKQANYLRNILNIGYRLTDNGDGSYTISGDEIEAITFEPEINV